jgi:hypothetical protein
LPFSDHGFDVVTGFNSFQYAGNPIVALGEARRVTRPGGTVVIVKEFVAHVERHLSQPSGLQVAQGEFLTIAAFENARDISVHDLDWIGGATIYGISDFRALLQSIDQSSAAVCGAVEHPMDSSLRSVLLVYTGVRRVIRLGLGSAR